MTEPLRTLLPKPTQDLDDSLDSNNALGKRKRTQHPSACMACRNRKSKCDGQRAGPCSACARKKTKCEYELGIGETRIGNLQKENIALQDQLSGHEAIMDLIRTSNELEANELFKRLRYSPSLGDAMDFILAGSLLLKSKPSHERSPPTNTKPAGDRTQHPHTAQNHEEIRQLYRTPSDSSVDSSKQQDSRRQITTSAHSPASAVSMGSTKYSSVSPPSWYAMPAPPTLYGGHPYVPHPSTHAAEPERISTKPLHQGPATSVMSQYRLPALPSIVAQATPNDSVPTAGAIKPLHVWPEYAIPEYNRTMPR